MDVPRELVEQFAGGNGVVFVGAGLSQGAGLPSWADLIRELVTELDDCPPDADYRNIAQYYDNRYGRNRLVQKLRDRLDTLDVHPTPVHEALVRLPVPVIFTTNYDDLLELALRAAKCPFESIIVNVDASFYTSDRLQLVKLHGDLGQPHSIVITTEDYEQFAFTRESLADILKVILQTRTVLFLGYSATDPDLQLILTQVRHQSGRFARNHYTVQFGALPPIVEDLEERRGLKVIDLGAQPNAAARSAALLKWLQELDRQVKQHKKVVTPSVVYTQQLAAEVKGLLLAMGFEILEGSQENKDVVFRARGVRAGEHINRWFLCLERGVTLEDVEKLKKRIEEVPGSKGWIVTLFHAIDADAQRSVEDFPSITVHTLANFYRQMLQYDGYLRELIGSSKEVDEYWVDLDCSVGEKKGSFNLVKYVDGWVKSPAQNHLALLGDFGTGKTWFCHYYAARAARQYLKDPDHHRIPILISLRGYARALNIEQLVTDTLINTYHIDLVGGFETFMHLNRYGRLLLIFDGFDEMERRVDYGVALQNYEEISRTVVERSKVILTSRPLFFADAEKVLRPGFEILSLRVFDDEQIQEVLRKREPRKWEKCWEQISGIQRLRDLASRPVMTQIISETLPTILGVGHIDGAALYRTYVDVWFEKSWKMGSQGLFRIRDDVLLLVRGLAWEMFPMGIIPQSELHERIKNKLVPKLGPRALTLGLEQLFVLDRTTGNYAFPHVSFMEYFVADKIVEDLAEEDVQSLLSCTLTDGVQEFLIDLIRARPEAQAGILNALLTAQSGEQINTLTELLTRLGEGNPVRPTIEMLETTDLLMEELPQHVVMTLGKEEFLNEVIKQLPKGAPSQVRHFLLELLGSPDIDTDRALRELTTVIYDDDSDSQVRLHAVQALGKRQGEKEIQALIEATGRQEMPTEIRQACIDNVRFSSLTDASIRNEFLNILHRVIGNSQDDIEARQYCVIKLAEYGFREALEPLLAILKDFSHVLWFVSANTISKTSESTLADDIEEEIILPHENDPSLLHQIAFLKSAVDYIRKPK